MRKDAHVTEDRFFRPDAEPEQKEWDGRPLALLSAEQVELLYATVPQWHAVAQGPTIPFSGGIRATIGVEYIFRTTREEALAVLESHVRSSCEQEGMVYNPEDWTIIRLALINGC
jgi:hypothetical protein